MIIKYRNGDVHSLTINGKDISEFSVEEKRKILVDIINRYEDCDLREEILCLACEFGTCKTIKDKIEGKIDIYTLDTYKTFKVK